MMLLSLRELSMRRVVVNLWKQPHILCRFHHRFIPPSFRSVRGIEIQIIDKMSELMCPESLKKEVRAIIAPIGIQIENWIKFHEFYLENPGWRRDLEKYSIDSHAKLCLPILKKLHFTDAGTIDYRKTAKVLILCKMFDVVKLYKLACLYCLKDCIPLLWQELPEEIKRKFYKEEGQFRIENSLNLQYCWPFILNGKKLKLHYMSSRCCGYLTTFERHALKYTIQDGNKAAAKYFFEQLTSEEKNIFLSRIELHLVDTEEVPILGRPAFTCGIFSSDNKAELFCYLLSQMNREQQIKFFDEHRRIIVSCFFNWPWQDLCLKLANLFRAFLFEDDYEFFLQQMYKLSKGSENSYGKLFQDFFPRCPLKFRKVDSSLLSARFLYEIFDFEDSKSAKVLLRNLSAADRMRFVSSEHFFELLHHNILLNKLNMVKLCLQEARLSEVCRENLKVAFVAFGAANKTRIKLQALVHSQFFQLLEEIYGENKSQGETIGQMVEGE